MKKGFVPVAELALSLLCAGTAAASDTGAATAIEDALKGRNSFERKLTEMKELKQTTPEDVAAYADILDKLASDGARVTVGSPQLIEEAATCLTRCLPG